MVAARYCWQHAATGNLGSKELATIKMLRHTHRPSSPDAHITSGMPYILCILSGQMEDLVCPRNFSVSATLVHIKNPSTLLQYFLPYFRSLSVILADSACTAPPLALLRKCSLTPCRLLCRSCEFRSEVACRVLLKIDQMVGK